MVKKTNDQFDPKWLEVVILKPNWFHRIFFRKRILKRHWFAIDQAHNGDLITAVHYTKNKNGKLVITHVKHNNQ